MMINPYLPCNEFVPDGEPHVFGDRVYVYGSHDTYGETYLCSGDYVCWSADAQHPIDWRFEGVIYKRIQDPFVKSVVDKKKGNMFNQFLYAPDVVEVGGKYYLYYGVAMSGSGIGVAVSNSPTGPFEYLGRVKYPEESKPKKWKDNLDCINDGDRALGDGMPMIQPNPFKKYFGMNFVNYPYDPALLYDDGHLYMYYGAGSCQMVELDTKDMRTVLKNEKGEYINGHLLPISSNKDDKATIAAQDGWYMANGSSIRKIDGRYYLSYYAINGKGSHAMCYSVASSPFGPFSFGGVLVSLGNGDKDIAPTAYVGNTHGGMAKLGGKWYQFYHRQTGDNCSARQSCMTELRLDEEGRFHRSEVLSQVEIEGGLPYTMEIPSYIACSFTDASGKTKKGASPYLHLRNHPEGMFEPSMTDGERTRQIVTGLKNGSAVGYKYIDFSEAEGRTIKASVKLCCSGKGRIDICTESGVLCSINTDVKKTDAVFTSESFPAPLGSKEIKVKFYGQTKSTDFVSLKFE